MLNPADVHQRAERAAAAEAIREVIGPATGCPELDWCRLLGCMTLARTTRHGAEFIRQLYPDVHSASLRREAAHDIRSIRLIAININDKRRITVCVQAHGGTENPSCLHPAGGDFLLRIQDGAHGRVISIQETQRRARGKAQWKEKRCKDGKAFAETFE